MDLICLTSARYTQRATILRQKRDVSNTGSPGKTIQEQDPDTGEIIDVWYPDEESSTPAGPAGNIIIDCMAEAIMDNGIRTNSASEVFKKENYFSYEYIVMTFDSSVFLTKRDRVTNITDGDGNILWMEEELDSKPTIFNVNGVKPVTDPFGTHVENVAMLSRAEIQER